MTCYRRRTICRSAHWAVSLDTFGRQLPGPTDRAHSPGGVAWSRCADVDGAISYDCGWIFATVPGRCRTH